MNLILISTRRERWSASQWDWANSVCFSVYLPFSPCSSMSWLEKFMSVSCSHLIISVGAVTGLFKAHWEECGTLGPFHVCLLVKKWPSTTQNLTIIWILTPVLHWVEVVTHLSDSPANKAAVSKALFLHIFSWVFEPKNLGWSYVGPPCMFFRSAVQVKASPHNAICICTTCGLITHDNQYDILLYDIDAR